jgi:hypothetical protein
MEVCGFTMTLGATSKELARLLKYAIKRAIAKAEGTGQIIK